MSRNDNSDRGDGPPRRGRRLSAEVEDRIEELSAHGLAAKRIHQMIGSDPELGPDCPDIRTLQRRLRIAGEKPESWSLAKGTAEEGVAVFAVLQDVIEETNGVVSWVTRMEAAMLVRLRPMVSGLRGWDVYLIARAYALREAGGHPTSDLDALLAYHPWTSSDALLAYSRAVALRHVPPGPKYLASQLSVQGWEDAFAHGSRGRV